MEELGVQDAVRVWIEWDKAHRDAGHAGTWEDFDPDGSTLRLGCAECITNKVIRVYQEKPAVLTNSR